MTKFYTLLIGLLLSLPLLSQDTFSIVAVDPETGEIGSAGATCVDGIAGFGGIKILNTIIPGRGGVNAQAWICINPHINLDNAIEQMQMGLNPDEIITWLTENDACSAQAFDPAYRQYGIADFDDQGNPRTAAFTGESADDYKGHIVGDNYTIQGNILLGPEVLEGMEMGFINTEGSLAEKLMAAMQGANIPGADSRCLARGTSSTSAFLKVVKPDDNMDEPFLLLDVLEMPFGEEPIDSLQSLFDAWIATSTSDLKPSTSGLNLFPNPVEHTLSVSLNKGNLSSWKVFNNLGQILISGQTDPIERTDIAVNGLDSGLYYILIKDEDGRNYISRFIKK